MGGNHPAGRLGDGGAAAGGADAGAGCSGERRRACEPLEPARSRRASRMRCCCSRSCTRSTPRPSCSRSSCSPCSGAAGSRVGGRCAALRLSLEDLPLALAVGFLLAHLPNALYPVLEHDDNVYHLYLPTRYLATHAFDAPVFSLYGAMPHLIEVLYVVPLALGDFVAGKLFAFSIHFWILAGLGGCVRPRLGRLGVGVAARCCTCPVRTSSGTSAAPTTSRSSASSCSGRRWRSASWWDTRRAAYLAIVGHRLRRRLRLEVHGLAVRRRDPRVHRGRDRSPRARARLDACVPRCFWWRPAAVLVLPWIVEEPRHDRQSRLSEPHRRLWRPVLVGDPGLPSLEVAGREWRRAQGPRELSAAAPAAGRPTRACSSPRPSRAA